MRSYRDYIAWLGDRDGGGDEAFWTEYLSGFDTVTPVLEEYGALTRAAMQDYLPKWEPRAYLYDPMADYPTRGGKMMRPSLCIATACAFGAPAEKAVRAAVAIEMLREAKGRGARLVVFPELALTTFFPRWHVADIAEFDHYYEPAMPNSAVQPLFDEARRLGVGFALGYAELERDGHMVCGAFGCQALQEPHSTLFG